MAHPKQDQVRRRYDFRCGYCGVSETDSGGELTIDHFRPISINGDDSDDNLVYACNRCNQFKSDFFPDPATSAPEYRLLHPLLDDAKLHTTAHGVCLLLCAGHVSMRRLAAGGDARVYQLQFPQSIENFSLLPATETVAAGRTTVRASQRRNMHLSALTE